MTVEPAARVIAATQRRLFVPSIRDRFDEFHDANPEVYAELRALALEMRSRGHARCGIGMLWEVLRWRRMLRTTDGEAGGFKLNNDFRAHYARLLERTVPGLAGFFEFRALRSD